MYNNYMKRKEEPFNVIETNKSLLQKIDECAAAKVREREKALESYKGRSIKATLWMLHDAIDPEIMENWARNNVGEVLNLLAKMEGNSGTGTNAAQISGGVQILNQFFNTHGQRRAEGVDGGVGETGPVLSAEICDGEE